MAKFRLSKVVLLRWAVTYLIILMIPMLCFLYGSMRSATVVREQISGTNQQLLHSLSKELDQNLTAMNDFYSYILKNDNFTVTRRAAKLDTDFRVDYAYKLFVELSKYTSSVSNGIGVLICYTDKQYIITNQGAYDFQPYYNVQKDAGSTLTEAEWQAALSAEYNPLQYLVSRELRINSNENCVVLACSVRGSSERINVFITIPLSVLGASGAELTDRYLLLTDAQGQSAAALTENPPVSALDPANPSGSIVTGTDNTRYICDYTRSRVNNWYYAVITSEESYWQQLKMLYTLIGLASLVALVLGVVLASVFLERNYRPVDQLLKNMNPSIPHRNEFELIEHSYRNLSDENKNMRTTLNRQAQQLRGQYLLSLLKGRSTALTGSDFNTHFEIAADGEVFTLAVFALGASEHARSSYRDELEYENMNLFAADNVFAELMGDLPYYKLEDGRLLIYLLHLDKANQAHWTRDGGAILERMCQLFLQELDVPLSVVLSESTDTLDRISALYQDATDALEYQNTIGGSGILRVSDYKQQTAGELLHEEHSQELTAAVTAGDADAAEAIVQQMFDEYRRSTAVTFPIFRIRVAELLYTLLDAYYELISDSEPRQRLVLNMEQVISAQNEAHLQTAFSSLLHFACTTVRAARVGSNGHFVDRICAYVYEHYTDNGLNIGSIAEAFNRNPQNISRVFHAQMQKGLLDYITEVRIEHARELMKTERLSQEEVSARVGFSSVRTFRRALSRSAKD